MTCVAAGEAEGEGTVRQREIIRELETFRPSWAPGSGVWMLGAWDIDIGLEALIALPSGRGNAAERFRMLEDLYPAEKEELGGGGAGTRGVDQLLEAADMEYCRFIPDYYPEFDSADAKQPDFGVMREYLKGLLNRGEKAMQAGDNRGAERCYRAAMLCGRHLMQDKSSSIIFATGLIFMRHGVQGYARYLLLTGQANKTDSVKVYAGRVEELMRAFNWKANTALSEFDGFACLPAVVRIMRDDAEVFWRKEAVVRLATLRYGVPDKAGEVVERDVRSERIADEALSEAAVRDPDESVRRLAIWLALNVTPENYVGMEHRFR